MARLERHGVRLVALGQSELSLEVLLEEGSFANDTLQGLVHCGLGSLALLIKGLLLVLLEEHLVILLLGRLWLGEEGIVHISWDLHAGNIHAGAGGDDVRLRDALERDAVDLVWACQITSRHVTEHIPPAHHHTAAVRTHKGCNTCLLR